MTAQVSGYTMTVRSTWGEDLFLANAGSISAVADPNYEATLWSMLDTMDAFLTSSEPNSAPFTPTLVRHEKEDVTLTHP